MTEVKILQIWSKKKSIMIISKLRHFSQAKEVMDVDIFMSYFVVVFIFISGMDKTKIRVRNTF